MTKLNGPTLGIAVVLALSGCGGGGSSPDLDLAAITSANAPVIASAVMGAALESSDLGAFTDFGAIAGSPKSSKATPVYTKMAEIQHTQLDALVKQSQTGIALVPIVPETTACVGGGSVTVSGNVANPATLSPNDTVVMDFDSCVEDGATVHGRFAMTITSFSANPSTGAFSFGMNVQLSTFQVATATGTATANGGISMTISVTSTGNLTTTVMSNSIAISDGSSSHTLSGYSLTQVFDGASGTFTLDLSGTLNSTAFSGAVTFDTVVLLQGTGNGFAYTGQVLITGANGATIRVIALDSALVRLEVDLNGDGTVDEIIDKSWVELT
jgi:hypothetical protein